MNNIYTDKYKNASHIGESNAYISLESVTKILAILDNAKIYLKKDDKPNWLDSFVKIFEIMRKLIMAVSAPELRDWGKQMVMYYTQLMHKASRAMIDAKKVEDVEELVLEFERLRDFIKDVIKNAKPVSSSDAGSGASSSVDGVL